MLLVAGGTGLVARPIINGLTQTQFVAASLSAFSACCPDSTQQPAHA